MSYSQVKVKDRIPKEEDFSPEDLAALAVIKKITDSGNNAEVKRNKGGGLTVYKIQKQIAG